MLIYYFFTKLNKHINKQKFLELAQDCLDNNINHELNLLVLLCDVDKFIRESFHAKNYSLNKHKNLRDLCDYYEHKNFTKLDLTSINNLRKFSWEYIHDKSKFKLVKNYSIHAREFYENLNSQKYLTHDDPNIIEQNIADSLYKIAESYACAEMFHEDQVILYFIKLIIYERLELLDEQRGQEILAELVRSSYER